MTRLICEWVVTISIIISAIVLPAYMILAYGWAEAFIGCAVLAVIKLATLMHIFGRKPEDPMGASQALGLSIVVIWCLMVLSYAGGLIRLFLR